MFKDIEGKFDAAIDAAIKEITTEKKDMTNKLNKLRDSFKLKIDEIQAEATYDNITDNMKDYDTRIFAPKVIQLSTWLTEQLNGLGELNQDIKNYITNFKKKTNITPNKETGIFEYTYMDFRVIPDDLETISQFMIDSGWIESNSPGLLYHSKSTSVPSKDSTGETTTQMEFYHKFFKRTDLQQLPYTIEFNGTNHFKSCVFLNYKRPQTKLITELDNLSTSPAQWNELEKQKILYAKIREHVKAGIEKKKKQ